MVVHAFHPDAFLLSSLSRCLSVLRLFSFRCDGPTLHLVSRPPTCCHLGGFRPDCSSSTLFFCAADCAVGPRVGVCVGARIKTSKPCPLFPTWSSKRSRAALLHCSVYTWKHDGLWLKHLLILDQECQTHLSSGSIFFQFDKTYRVGKESCNGSICILHYCWPTTYFDTTPTKTLHQMLYSSRTPISP